MFAPAVQELELPLQVFDHHALSGFFRSHEEFAAATHGLDLPFSVIICVARAVGLAGENAHLVADAVGLVEQYSRKELQVKADFPYPFGGQRLLEIHDDAERAPLRLNPEVVFEIEVGINDRVESLAVTAGVRIGHHYGDLLFFMVNHTGARLGYGRPLTRRGLQPDVAVGGYPEPVLDDTYPALVTFGIKIMRQHHIEAAHLQVFELVDHESVPGLPRTGGRQYEQKDKERGDFFSDHH